MKLRGIRFRYAFDQSGVRNFNGQGWPYHRYLKRVGLSFNNCTFVAKTTTLHPRRGKKYNEPGNMPLLEDGMTPAQFMPKCIYVSPHSWLKGAAINAVGLAGPGLDALLATHGWECYKDPFMISLTTVEPTLPGRLKEIEEMACKIKHKSFFSRFGVQLNITCPNLTHEEQQIEQIVSETRETLAILRRILGDSVPLVVKINAIFPVEAAMQICDDPNCDGLANSNAIPWNDVPEAVRLDLFGTTTSPLAHLGGGGVSGAYLLPLVVLWIKQARCAGLRKHIIAGGGILKPADVDQLAAAGASAIAVGSASFLRPRQVQKIIDRANDIGSGLVQTLGFSR